MSVLEKDKERDDADEILKRLLIEQLIIKKSFKKSGGANNEDLIGDTPKNFI